MLKPDRTIYKDEVYFLDDNHNVVSQDKATLIKVFSGGNIIFLLPDKAPEDTDVKKNPPGSRTKKRQSGRPMTPLLGVGNAASRLAHKLHSNTTSGKS